MSEVILELRALAVEALEFALLLLVTGRVGVAWVGWQVEARDSCVARAVGSRNEQTLLYPELPGQKEFVLRVGAAAELSIRHRRLGPVSVADDLNEPFAGFELPAEHGAEVARLRTPDVLGDRFVTFSD